MFFSRNITVNKSLNKLTDLIIDVNSYPDFLPFCSEVEIIEKHKDCLKAKMTVKFLGKRYSFTSTTRLTINENQHIIITKNEEQDSLIKSLISQWNLAYIDDYNTAVGYNIEIDLQNILQNKLLGSVFRMVSQRVVEAFIRR